MPYGRKPGEIPEEGPKPKTGRKPRMTLEERRERSRQRAQISVPKILSADPVCFPVRLKAALEYFYVQDQNHREKAINTAAKLAGMDPVELRRFMNQPAVYEVVQRRLDRIDFCKAAYIAKAQVLDLHFVDTHLAKAVRVAAADGDSKPMELAYDRLGVRRDKNFMTTEQASPQSRPQIYRVLEQTVTRTEQVTQREITTDRQDGVSLLPSARNLDSEILDY